MWALDGTTDVLKLRRTRFKEFLFLKTICPSGWIWRAVDDDLSPKRAWSWLHILDSLKALPQTRRCPQQNRKEDKLCRSRPILFILYLPTSSSVYVHTHALYLGQSSTSKHQQLHRACDRITLLLKSWIRHKLIKSAFAWGNNTHWLSLDV